MTKSYFPHLSTVLFAHALVLLGTWQLSQAELVKAKVGTGVLKLQIATHLLKTSPVQKKVVKAPTVNPLKPKTAPVVEETPIPETQEVRTESAAGSAFGTSSLGKTDLLSAYKAELRAMIDKNKYYPPLSRRLGQKGTVVVAFTLLEDGNIIDVHIHKPSRFERLNDSAVEAVRKVGKFRPIPKEVGEGPMDITVPVKFFTI